MNILIVGSGAREHAIAKALHQSKSIKTLYCFGTHINPGIAELTADYICGDITNTHQVLDAAQSWAIQLAIIGPEAPLEKGLVDALEQKNIPCVGPKQRLAQIETSKAFTRQLFQTYNIPGSPKFKYFTGLDGVESFLLQLGEGQYVIKADGLMGGKGVKVAGDHLHSIDEAVAFCTSLSEQGHSFIIEEKLIGQEFSLLCFTDGTTLVPMPLVQDHKRAYEQDKGPNTGGMGSYSDANHLLPFISKDDHGAANQINKAVLDALKHSCGAPFKGILYSSFIATQSGVYVIEYNARFGDPEALNVLPLFVGDFVAVCKAIADGTLAQQPISFKPLATVCKYAVPLGYPDKPIKDIPISIDNVVNKNSLYFGSISEHDGCLYGQGSRAIAAVGIAETISEAENQAEAEISRIQGQLFHRKDIGTKALIDHRVSMMNDLRQEQLVE
jgi:phosphoribosylamine---glycine ligase